MAVTLNLNLSATVQDSKTTGTLGNYTGTPRLDHGRQLTSSDVTKAYSTSGTSATPVTLDLTALTNAYGVALTFATVKLVVISNNATTTPSLVVGGGLTPALGTDQFTIKTGRAVYSDSEYTIDATHKLLVITPSASCAYSVLIVGT